MAKTNNTRGNIAANLRDLRTYSRMSQEDVAERIGVSRQAVAKWEAGETLPDILNCEALSDLFEVSLTDLVRHDPDKAGIGIGPKDKHIFGIVTINEKGQIVLPKKARDTLGYHAGDSLVILGDTSPGMNGLALVDSKSFLQMTGMAVDKIFGEE